IEYIRKDYDRNFPSGTKSPLYQFLSEVKTMGVPAEFAVFGKQDRQRQEREREPGFVPPPYPNRYDESPLPPDPAKSGPADIMSPFTRPQRFHRWWQRM